LGGPLAELLERSDQQRLHVQWGSWAARACRRRA